MVACRLWVDSLQPTFAKNSQLVLVYYRIHQIEMDKMHQQTTVICGMATLYTPSVITIGLFSVFCLFSPFQFTAVMRRPTFICDWNRWSGRVVCLVLRLEARRQVFEIELFKCLGVVFAQPQINIQLSLYCPSTLALALLPGLLFVAKHTAFNRFNYMYAFKKQTVTPMWHT